MFPFDYCTRVVFRVEPDEWAQSKEHHGFGRGRSHLSEALPLPYARDFLFPLHIQENTTPTFDDNQQKTYLSAARQDRPAGSRVNVLREFSLCR
jgi:hypothetical protein